MNNNIDLTSITDLLKKFGTQYAPQTGAKIENSPWYQTYGYPEASEISIDKLISFTKNALFFQALTNNEKVFDYEDSISLDKDITTIYSLLQKEGMREVYEQTDESKLIKKFFVNDFSGLFICIQLSNKMFTKTAIDYNVVTTNKLHLDKIINCFNLAR